MANALEVAKLAQRVAQAAPAARVKIVGLWVWVDFDGKPDVTVRDMLKAERFHWNKNRQCWQFRGTEYRTGPSRADRWYLEEKYGSQEVEAHDAAQVGV